jgi:predicted MFS family arabinose efflux permease
VKSKNKTPNYLKFTSLGFQILVTVGLGVVIGQWLDSKYPNKNSIYTIICSMVMIMVAMYQVIRTLKD